MSDLRRIGMLIGILILSLGLLAACGGDDNTSGNLGTDPDAGFGDPDAGIGNVDVTAAIDPDAGLAPTPLAPELTVTDEMTATVTTEVTEEAATPTTMPEATATAEIEPTAEMTATEEAVTGTVDLGDSYLVRASTLLDLDWADEVGADLTVSDLREILFDEEGTIHYAVVDLDGADGTNTVAVPWSELNVQSVAGVETAASVYGLTWAEGVTAPTTTAVDVELLDRDDDDIAGLEGVVDATELGLAGDMTRLFRASAFIDEGIFDDDFDDVEDPNGEDLGDIENLLIDVNAGMVVYAVMDIDDDILDMDDEVAIPWSRFTLDESADDGDGRLVGDVDAATLQSAPVIDRTADFGDDDFRLDDALRAELDSYWEIDANQ